MPLADLPQGMADQFAPQLAKHMYCTALTLGHCVSKDQNTEGDKKHVTTLAVSPKHVEIWGGGEKTRHNISTETGYPNLPLDGSFDGAQTAMHDSTLQTSCVQGQLVRVALSFLRNFGILSGVNGVLEALTSGAASAALDDKFAVHLAQQKQVSLRLQSPSGAG